MDDEEFEIEENEDDSSTDNSNNSTMDSLLGVVRDNKKLFIIIGIIILLLIIMSFVTKSSNSKEIKLSKEEDTIAIGAGVQLQLLVDGKETNTGVTWESTDTRVATVDDKGGVHAVSAGETTIIARYENEKYTCNIKVSEGDSGIAIESIKFGDGTLVMSVGSTYTPVVEITPSDAKIKNKLFYVSNEDIATVDKLTGLVTANKVGSTMLRVSVNDAFKINSIKLEVIDGEITPGIYILPTSITLPEKEITLTEGDRKAVTYTQEPSNATADNVKWVSADPSIAVVENNELIARKAGDVVITITSFGVKDTMMVHVKAASVDVKSLTITSSTSLTMEIGNTEEISYKISPSNATNKEVIYESDDSTVATVDSVGNITATGAGTTTIKVSSASKPNIYGTISVTVNSPYVPETPSDTPGGGGSSDSGTTVGTVKLTSNNNAVEKTVDAVAGKTMTSTQLTVTPSGNVDKVMYCYYNYNTQSSCSSYTVYSGPFTFNSVGTFVFKVIPYYNNNAGTEITRYVKISSSGSSNKCAAGKYWDGSSCKGCPAGNYCSNDNKVACPAGKGSVANSTSPSDCQYCAKGTYATGDGAGCKECPRGTTTTSTGSTSSTQCISTAASTITCNQGLYYNGSGSCSTCPANYWCPGVTASKTDTTIKGKNACGNNKTSPAGSTKESDCVSSGGNGGNSDDADRPEIVSMSIPSVTTDYVYGILGGHWPFIELNNAKGSKAYNRIALCYYVISTGSSLDNSKCTTSSSKGSDITPFERSGRQTIKVPKQENKWHMAILNNTLTSGSFYVETEQMDAWGQGDSRYQLVLVIRLGYYKNGKTLLSNNYKAIRVRSTNATPFKWPIDIIR